MDWRIRGKHNCKGRLNVNFVGLKFKIQFLVFKPIQEAVYMVYQFKVAKLRPYKYNTRKA